MNTMKNMRYAALLLCLNLSLIQAAPVSHYFHGDRVRVSESYLIETTCLLAGGAGLTLLGIGMIRAGLRESEEVSVAFRCRKIQGGVGLVAADDTFTTF